MSREKERPHITDSQLYKERKKKNWSSSFKLPPLGGTLLSLGTYYSLMAWYAFQVVLRVRICSLNAHLIILFVMCICVCKGGSCESGGYWETLSL